MTAAAQCYRNDGGSPLNGGGVTASGAYDSTNAPQSINRVRISSDIPNSSCSNSINSPGVRSRVTMLLAERTVNAGPESIHCSPSRLRRAC